MLEEIESKNKPEKLIQSPRVRVNETKAFFSFGYFTMMFSYMLINQRITFKEGLRTSELRTEGTTEDEAEIEQVPTLPEEIPQHPGDPRDSITS